MIGLLGLLVSACGSGTAPEPEAEGEPPPIPPRVVGEIASVHPEEGFVLIRRTGLATLPAGMAYSSVGADGRTAALRLTGERLGRFFAADIGGGDPAAGDLVVVRSLPQGSQPSLTPAPAGVPDRPMGLPEAEIRGF